MKMLVTGREADDSDIRYEKAGTVSLPCLLLYFCMVKSTRMRQFEKVALCPWNVRREKYRGTGRFCRIADEIRFCAVRAFAVPSEFSRLQGDDAVFRVVLLRISVVNSRGFTGLTAPETGNPLFV